MASYVTIKELTIKGVTFKKGDPFDVKLITSQKLSQLLDQRWLALKST